MDTAKRNLGLKTRIRFSTSLDKNLAQKLEALSEDTRIAKSKLLDEALVTKQDIIDNHNNVRMARAVTNIENSNFAKKILSMADEELVREAIRNFKKKRGRNATFLIQMLVDEYYKAGIRFSQVMLNLLRKGLKFQNIEQVSSDYY